MIEIINEKPVGYKTPQEIAEDWGVPAQTARVYIKRYGVEVLKIGQQIYVADGTPKPTTRSNKKWKTKNNDGG